MKQRELLIIIIPTFILTVLWVMFTVYHNSTTSTIEDPLSIQIIPISGQFDLKTLDSLKKRTKVEPEYEAGLTVNQLSPTPAPPTPTSVQEVPIISPSIEPSTTPEATPEISPTGSQ